MSACWPNFDFLVHLIWEIWRVPKNRGPERPLGVTLGDRKWYRWIPMAGLLIVFYSNYRPKMHRLATIHCRYTQTDRQTDDITRLLPIGTSTLRCGEWCVWKWIQKETRYSVSMSQPARQRLHAGYSRRGCTVGDCSVYYLQHNTKYYTCNTSTITMNLNELFKVISRSFYFWRGMMQNDPTATMTDT